MDWKDQNLGNPDAAPEPIDGNSASNHDFFGSSADETVTSFQTGTREEALHDIEESPYSPAVRRLIQKGYEWEFSPPELSSGAKLIGGYKRDRKPKGFNEQFEQREREQTLTPDPVKLQCSLSDRFADKVTFRPKNVLLEILQNAEPRDSKGTWFGFEF